MQLWESLSDPSAEFVCEETGWDCRDQGTLRPGDRRRKAALLRARVGLRAFGGDRRVILRKPILVVVMSSETLVVHSDPEILGGTPVFVGTRVPVKSLYDYLEAGDSLDVFLHNFPSVTREQAVAAHELARAMTEAHATAGR
jgi:uncharacterized protein (DUF433 family)